ncbi:hypothetical protein [Haloarchaeobius amylolyticus]|uniref:hypothetical protein n=1 Tax=Haloarchaeobius amylolyticus TaxID=1198296 RepID=UPI00226EFF95|nr:hypothetical protein [Haloarchaeobius amylolyticus]
MADDGDDERSLAHEAVGVVTGVATVVLALVAGLAAGFEVLLFLVRLSNRPRFAGQVDTPAVAVGLLAVVLVSVAVFLACIYVASRLFEAVETRVT